METVDLLEVILIGIVALCGIGGIGYVLLSEKKDEY